MDDKSGWVEKRQHERIVATLKVNFHVIRSDEAKKLLENDRYRNTTAEQLPELSLKSNLYKAVTKDISLGGLALVSQEVLSRGMLLEVNLQLPSYKTSLKFLAEVMHVETFEEMGKTLFTAGMKTMAISKDDVQRIADYLIKQNKAKS
jgi:hypothetical protein